MFDKVTIIGFGLIGSSIARGVRKHGLCRRLTAVDTSAAVCEELMALGLADEATTSLEKGVQGADLVVIAVPVGNYGAVAAQISNFLKPGAIVTDVGSVKGAIIEAVRPHIPPGVHFVPGHPIAGTEHSGPAAGFAELFVNRWCILTPLPETEVVAVGRMTQFWERLGSMIEIMDAKRHDLVLGITSHVPHLIAYTIVGTATDLETHLKDDVISFSASGFRDFTRIAASNPIMWRDIFMNNKEAVLEILQRFSEDLTALQRAIRWGDGDYLEDVFTKTREIRRKIIDAGQANYPAPQPAAQPEQPDLASSPAAGTPPAEAPDKASGSVSG